MIKRVRDFLERYPKVIEEIPIYLINDKHARNLARNIQLENSITTVNAYMCSDSRNKAIRELLFRVPGVRVYSNAGGIIYNPSYLCSIVFDHGSQCGARGYAQKVKSETGKKLIFPYFAEEVHPEMMKNAEKQLSKIPEKFRGGIIYFNQEKGEIIHRITDKNKETYEHAFECERVVHQLKSLKYRYSPEEFASMADGQNPHIILLTNGFVNYNADIFRIDLQQNSLHGIIYDSLKYAVTHALNSEKSFKDTDAVIICIDKINHPIPKGFSTFFGKILPMLQDFNARGGETILMSLGADEGDKRIYRII